MTTAGSPVDQAIAKLKALRKGSTLGGLSWKELDEGRRSKRRAREALPAGELSLAVVPSGQQTRKGN